MSKSVLEPISLSKSITEEIEFKTKKENVIQPLTPERLPAEDAIMSKSQIKPLSKISMPKLSELMESDERLQNEKRFNIDDLLRMPDYQTQKMTDQIIKHNQDFRRRELDTFNKDYSTISHSQIKSQSSPNAHLDYSVDTTSFIRAELHNDLKRRREQERQQMQHAKEQTKLEILKNMALSKDFEPNITPKVNISNRQGIREDVMQENSNIKREVERIDQEIKDKMKESENKLKSLRDSSNQLMVGSNRNKYNEIPDSVKLTEAELEFLQEGT